jgi:hypothetical protein
MEKVHIANNSLKIAGRSFHLFLQMVPCIMVAGATVKPKFEWDPDIAKKNYSKNGIDFN